MEELEITSVAEFHDRVDSLRKWNAVFRGENSDHYQLKPKLARYEGKRLNRAIEVEQEIIGNFRRSAQPFLDGPVTSDLEWMALAQHHGLATRLLDWTDNPLVAAFFAVHGKLVGDAVIYAFNQYELEQIDLHHSPFDIEKPFVFRPQHISPRIAAQAGILTVQHALRDEFRVEGMQRWIIREESLIKLDSLLLRYGVHPASLFPGLDGVAKSVMTKWMGD